MRLRRSEDAAGAGLLGSFKCQRAIPGGKHEVRRTCATLLVDLEVRLRVIMRILRHVDGAMTTEIYAQANSTAASETLPRLGESLR